MKLIVTLPLLIFFCTGCLTTTVRFKETPEEKVYETSKDFYLFGKFPDEQRVPSSEICGDREVARMQTQTTFLDGLLSFVTLGIYSPKTLRVWCEKSEEEDNDEEA